MMQEDLDTSTEEAVSLRALANYAKHFRPRFSACGYFDISKRLVFSIAGTSMTYFIVVLQLNDGQHLNLNDDE